MQEKEAIWLVRVEQHHAIINNTIDNNKKRSFKYNTERLPTSPLDGISPAYKSDFFLKKNSQENEKIGKKESGNKRNKTKRKTNG